MKSRLLILLICAIVFVLVLPDVIQTTTAQEPPPTPTPTLVPPDDASEPQPASVPQKATQEDQQSLDSSEVLETLTVPVDGTSVQTSFDLAEGVVYTIRVSGVYKWGNCDAIHCPGGGPDYIRWGDAEYLTDDNWQSFSDPFWSGFVYFEVNGSDLDFGPFNPDHIYSIQITGNGQPATFRFHDCDPCYGDNAGSLTVEILQEKQIDLSISEIKPIHVVEDTDVNGDMRTDLVLGKPMVVRVNINVSNAESFTPEQLGQNVEVALNFQGSILTESRTINELLTGPVDFFLTPGDFGDSSILVIIDQENMINETDEDNNNNQNSPTLVTIKDTGGLYVAYLRVDCLGSLETYADTVSQAGEFLSAVYPINPDPSEFTNKRFDSSITCLGGLKRDSFALWTEGKLRSKGKAQYVVGIVDSNWANSRMPNSNGITWCGASRSFVLDGQWTTVAHEIGHGFELSHPTDGPQVRCKATPNTSSTQGYWVDQRRIIQGAASLMGPGAITPPPFPQNNRWITRDDYEHLFTNKLEDATDPEVLLVSFILHKDDVVEWEPFYRLPIGILDNAEPGEYSLKVLDTLGQALYELPFKAHFFVLTHPPSATDAIPFGFAIPYPAEATTVQVQHNGQVIAQESTSTKLLRDAVMSIPDAGFIDNPDQLRNALLNKINEFDAKLNSGDLIEARNKLEKDIRKHLDNWLIDGYPTSSPLEYTKPAILELVDELLQRLEN